MWIEDRKGDQKIDAQKLKRQQQQQNHSLENGSAYTHAGFNPRDLGDPK